MTDPDPAPILAEARDLCEVLIAEDGLGRTSDEAMGRAVRAMLGRVRTLLAQINVPASRTWHCSICSAPVAEVNCPSHQPGMCRG